MTHFRDGERTACGRSVANTVIMSWTEAWRAVSCRACLRKKPEETHLLVRKAAMAQVPSLLKKEELQVKYTAEDVKRLMPEAEIYNMVHLIVIVCGEKPGNRIEADLAFALLDTRRQLEIAQVGLKGIISGSNDVATQYAAEQTLAAIEGVTK
jgi:hypothetical protein